VSEETAVDQEDFAHKPFKGAEDGVNLFWLDGVNRYVYFEAGGPRLAVYFLVNVGRKGVSNSILPEPTAVFLSRSLLKPNDWGLGVDDRRFYPMVCQKLVVYELPVGKKDVLHEIANDPHFFDPEDV
jgi:hypothetical protein